MSGDARITGQIRIDPPVRWSELYDQQWAIGQQTDHYQDAYIELATTEENTPDGVVMRHSGVAIIPTGYETNGYDLLDDVTRIVRLVATAPDGTARTFTGHLHVVWGGGKDVYRVVVRDGHAVEVRPTVVWPDDAQDGAR